VGACAAGKYRTFDAERGWFYCKPCGKGTYTNLPGQSACRECAVTGYTTRVRPLPGFAKLSYITGCPPGRVAWPGLSTRRRRSQSFSLLLATHPTETESSA
jgi:hypothetical protein